MRLTMALLQDVSRLVDICRQTIYFDTLEGVRQCLDEMDRDSDVQLVRCLPLLPCIRTPVCAILSASVPGQILALEVAQALCADAGPDQESLRPQP